jgi:hypothetical protein
MALTLAVVTQFHFWPIDAYDNTHTPVKKKLRWSAVVSCAYERMLLFPAVLYLVRAVYEFLSFSFF